MKIADKAVLVTGANRGIGQALVEEALKRGAKRVYAGTRQILTHSDERVMPLTLDVTDATQVQEAARIVESLDLLINNAGVLFFDELNDRDVLDQHLAVNLFGTHRVTQAFLPQLTTARGAIVNNLSLMALAPFPFTPAYSLSKAAAFSLTQSLRTQLLGQGVQCSRSHPSISHHRLETTYLNGLQARLAAHAASARGEGAALEH